MVGKMKIMSNIRLLIATTSMTTHACICPFNYCLLSKALSHPG